MTVKWRPCQMRPRVSGAGGHTAVLSWDLQGSALWPQGCGRYSMAARRYSSVGAFQFCNHRRQHLLFVC